MNAPLLVFGASGQVGQELLALAKKRAVPAVGLTHTQADIVNERDVVAAFLRVRPKIVVNAAAYTAVDRAEQERDAAFAANAEGPAVLGRIAARAGASVIHLSTDYVFDGFKAGAYREDDTLAPIGAYGESKAAGERNLQKTGVKYVVLRTSWVYSSYGNNFLKTILRLARERDELRVVADQFGCPTAALDIAEAILAVARRMEADPVETFGIFHFAGTGCTSWHGFASEIVRAQERFTRRAPHVTPIATSDYPTPARRPKNSELDSSSFERNFGYRARRWQDMVIELVAQLCESQRAEAGT